MNRWNQWTRMSIFMVITCTSHAFAQSTSPTSGLCGGKLRASSGTITSPGYPTAAYSHSLTCAWTIEATPNQIITLRVTDLALESTQNCLYDFLDVYNGTSSNATRILHVCNSVSTITTVTKSKMYILFRSDESVSRKGFSATYEITNAEE
ncbi:procollagen C-endopeptidase enhancer 1-like [Biomphalaria glabrata]|uniref:Procollagen C-endopeptidase enhancer 1-like n=1 Tax=Biomphalaria glabrata TaxID=6526 RepID=A0A9W2YC38_BIOGL|nr:procollagen C-endopeptidase enhancer 1-like [Biomphalaria glabrata]